MWNSLPKDITEDEIQSGMEYLETNKTIMTYSDKNVEKTPHEKSYASQALMFWLLGSHRSSLHVFRLYSLSLWCSTGNFTTTLLKRTLMHLSTLLPINTWQKLHRGCLMAALLGFSLGPSEPRTTPTNSKNYHHEQILDSFFGKYKTKRVALTFPDRE